MSTPLPEHDHCKYCGDPVPHELAYCKEECYWNDQKRKKSEKTKNIVYGMLVVASLLALVALRLLSV